MAAQNKTHPKRAFKNLYGLTRRLPSRFVKDETGAVTVEFVLWVPVFVLILAITVDASVLFLTQSNLWSIARDTTRIMATGRLLDGTAAADYARGRMSTWGADAEINKIIDLDEVTLTIRIPIADVSPFNIVGAFTSGDISVALTQHREPS